jgi:TonB family protein
MKKQVMFTVLIASLVFSGGLNANEPKTASELPKLVKPEVTKKVLPTYPTVLRTYGVEGRVLVEGLLDQTGKLHGITVVESTHARLSEATVKALKAWTFEPAMDAGKPVAVVLQVPFNFRLKVPGTSDGRIDYGDLEPIVMTP